MPKNRTHYKILNVDGSPCNGGSGMWDVTGGWMPEIKPVIPREQGYHVCEFRDLLSWAGPALWEVEIRGEVVRERDKTVASEARLIRRIETWNDKNLRLFAADCAEHVLDIYCKANPEDGGMALMYAIHIAREYAHGRAGDDDLDAARYAARDAAWAAWAARDAAWAAWAARDAARAARDAAWAARDAWAARAAGAAGDAARAARDAAEAARDAWAAGDAARAAGDAWAAGDAAWAAAWAAARDAEREWQLGRLAQYLEVPHEA